MSNPRYTRQRLNSDCALATVANMFKFYNKPISYRHNLPTLKEMFHYDDGVFLDDISEYFADQNVFNVRYAKNPSISELRKHLRNGNAAFFTYKTPAEYHSVLAIKDYNFGVTIVGESKKHPTVTNMPYYFAEEMLKDSHVFFVDLCEQ